MSHFIYKQLPAKGIGQRDPQRPYVTGGLGAGVAVFSGDLGGIRTYDGNRILDTLAREGELVRAYSPSARDGMVDRAHTKTGRSGSTDRTYSGSRSSVGPSRGYSGDRDYDKKER